jgi:hypothetical protein
VQVKEWTVTLDTYTVSTERLKSRTRVCAPYVNKDGLRFTIYRAGGLATAKHFGMQDVEVGGPVVGDVGPLFGADVSRSNKH